MIGRLPGGQQRLFYSFNLEDHVPPQHLLRSIDQCLDLSDLRAHLADFYSPIGRPSIDPELMVRMLVVGYCYGIRSERRLCEEVHLNLAYRWFCWLGLEDEVPNHSTFSKNRHGRFRDSGLFRWLFNEVLRRCMAAGLVKGKVSPSTPASSRRMPAGNVGWRVMKSIGTIQSSAAEPCASTSKPLMKRRWLTLFPRKFRSPILCPVGLLLQVARPTLPTPRTT
ncbi:ISSag8, transposase [Streptococcus dysgalactiae subsp. equisimilis]|nr:ISSag8, transposase [Streptococcus dysgalactiae subsp. equisimilis]